MFLFWQKIKVGDEVFIDNSNFLAVQTYHRHQVSGKEYTTYTFKKAGMYFPTLSVASQRDGDAKTPFARIQNLDRVSVVVK